MSEETKKESTDNNQITLKVVDPQGGETVFRIRKTTKFTKLFKVYCERKGYQLGSIKFTFDGILVDEEQTPDELDMEDEDIIEAHLRQVGGF
ncbi:small ubiquitin-related modifier [Anaeramoeba flamelloides]|uniref:Small ubiquitin-related modifier n=1 Tax=Anaeramoeba flamelloides TaxID=1746091 RepID=A0AAV7YG75_9EUKA|nr:small ubiquitin-related modifier [Anaeramoeba flamelloides]KAJ6236202.1 small ubiquitin-related modifier [Anaeramoeba flamelloides]